jgi:2'-5' RNA ligase
VKRLFVAIPVPSDSEEDLVPLIGGLPGARWVGEGDLHLTLRFIGDVDGAKESMLRERLGTILFDPFPLAMRGLGTFPPKGPPRVLWVGVEPSDALMALRRAVDRCVTAVGLKPDGRKFIPHVTLARLRDTPVSRLQRHLVTHSRFDAEPFLVEEFTLFSSVLRPDGARYTVEGSYGPLGRL